VVGYCSCPVRLYASVSVYVRLRALSAPAARTATSRPCPSCSVWRRKMDAAIDETVKGLRPAPAKR
jgi:hypothetical protein